MRFPSWTSVLLACACANGHPASSTRPPLEAAEDRVDASIAAAPADAGPVEVEAGDAFGRCIAGPIRWGDAKTPDKLSELEEKRLAFATKFVDENQGSRDAKAPVPKEITDSQQHEGGSIDIPNAKLLQATLWFKKGDYKHALRASHDVLSRFPDRDEALHAIEIEMVVLQYLGGSVEPRRRECFEAMLVQLERVLAAVCQQPADKYRKKRCEDLARIHEDLRERMN